MNISIFLLPLLSFIIAGSIGLFLKDNNKADFLKFIAWLVSSVFITVTAGLALILFLSIIKTEENVVIYLMNWFVSGNLFINITFVFDILTSLMVFIISFVSALVHIYSYFYIDKKDNLARFQGYLSLFTFSMILLVTADNLLQMFIGWELISFCSYLLIIFWYTKETANYAASKAFLINKFADIAFVLGIFVTFALFGSLNFEVINDSAVGKANEIFSVLGYNISLIDLMAFLFMFAAFAKSAQIGLHIWLPDAMEAPTPVSALLHAATMVTAGIFLVVKLSPVFILSETISNVIIIVAAITAIYASLVACMQDDIKKIIAYSTVSQLGYMFLSVGAGLYHIAIFHLFTHAFFKALLFLSAGSVIHGVAGEQNIKKMGNLWRKMPVTYVAMWIGSLALIGIPGFAGFYSKEAILQGLSASSNTYANFGLIVALITIFFTAFYSFRLILRVFHGKANYGSEVHVHESSFGMLSVLIILMIMSVFAGKFAMQDFIGDDKILFWKNSLYIATNMGEPNHMIEIYSLLIIALAFVFIYVIYIREKNFSLKLIKTFPISYKIVTNKFYFDYVYDNIICKFISYISKKLLAIDDYIVDRYGVNSIPSMLYRFSKISYKTQNGSVNFYAFIMVLGLFAILTFCFIIY